MDIYRRYCYNNFLYSNLKVVPYGTVYKRWTLNEAMFGAWSASLYIYTQDRNLFTTLSADGIEPTGARPSADSMLII